MMKRFFIWSAIALPPTLLILLSVKPLEIISLRLLGCLAAAFLTIVIVVLLALPALRFQKRFQWQAAISLVIVVSIIMFNWPLRIAYAFSRPAFDRVAEQVMAGETIATPRRIGWFRVERIEAPGPAANEIDDHGLLLWTGIHPNGNTGFVRSSPEDLRFNLWSHFQLDETWQLIAED